ncbi:MAG: sugar ABC transporter permease, partial [Spirochaetales bacterium]|nr:sugar ABC transporter permease [Spirochaetales bacterium]
FFLSFSNWDMVKNTGSFIGIKNFIYLFQNEKFRKSLVNTAYFAGLKIPLDLVISLAVAIMLDKKIKFRRFFRAAYFLPVIIPMVAASIIWLWLYNPTVGPLNQVLKFFHFRPIEWLYDPQLSMLCIIMFTLWKGLGYDIVIFLAGLQSIPASYIDAARVDGASPRTIFFRITLPLMSPIIYFVVLIGFIKSFNVFTQISVMTPKGGALYSTGVMVFYIYEQAFKNYRMGRAAAASVILFFIIIIITVIQKQIGKKTVYHN